MNPYMNLVFNTNDNKTFTMKISNCNKSALPAEINLAMDTIVTNNIFSDKTLVSKNSATIVEEVVTQYTIN